MFKNGYFEHFSPTGHSPWNFISEAGYDYQYAGENLAIDFAKLEDTHTAWMNSPKHRENILNSDFTEIGIATVTKKFKGRLATISVEMFGTPAPAFSGVINR